MNLRTPMAAKGLGAAGMLLIAGAGWVFALGPQTSALGEVHEATEAAVSQNQQMTAQLVQLQDQAKHLEDTKRTAAALAERFPATADQPGLFEQVTTAAGRAGIGPRDVTALTPTPPTFGSPDADGSVQPTSESDQRIARQTVTVSVEGNAVATRRLLRNLETIPRAFLVKDVTVQAGESSSYTSTITGDMFVMPPATYPEAAEASEESP
ncbi:MAG TPA: hypothetical protein VER39_06965 [Nocardioidaceae bacterium]|nr:hypothetical protein [Nocardioidaceae bacterium]